MFERQGFAIILVLLARPRNAPFFGSAVKLREGSEDPAAARNLLRVPPWKSETTTTTTNNTAPSPAEDRNLAKGTWFFAQDSNGVVDELGAVVPLASHPNSDQAFEDFCAVASGHTIVTEDFESYLFLARPPLTIGSGGLTAIVAERGRPLAYVDTDRATNGMYPISGSKFFRVPTRSKTTFVPVGGIKLLGFAFYATDILDETLNRRVTILTRNADGSNKKRYRPKVENADGQANGAVFFCGIYDAEGFDLLQISNGKSDGFGIDQVMLVADVPMGCSLVDNGESAEITCLQDGVETTAVVSDGDDGVDGSEGNKDPV